jgi:hypothetical protein
MANAKISNKVFRLKRAGTFNLPGIPDPVTFDNGEEFHIIGDVLYMKGFLVPGNLQHPIINWIVNNKILFVEDTRNF